MILTVEINMGVFICTQQIRLIFLRADDLKYEVNQLWPGNQGFKIVKAIEYNNNNSITWGIK